MSGTQGHTDAGDAYQEYIARKRQRERVLPRATRERPSYEGVAFLILFGPVILPFVLGAWLLEKLGLMKPQPVAPGTSVYDSGHPDYYKRTSSPQQLWQRWDPVQKIYRLYTYDELVKYGRLNG